MVACLALAKAVILPAAVAILLAFVLNPFVSALDRRGIPRVPSVFLVVILVGALVGSLGWILASQMVQFLNQLPSYQDNVTHRVEELRAQQQELDRRQGRGLHRERDGRGDLAAARIGQGIAEAGQRTRLEAPGRPGSRPATAAGHRRDVRFVGATRPVGDDRRYAVGVPRFRRAWCSCW